MAFFKVKNRLFPKQIIKRLYLSIMFIAIIPMLFLAIIAPLAMQNHKDHTEKELYFVAEKFSQAIAKAYYQSGETVNWPENVESKQERLYDLLKPIVTDFHEKYPGTALGFYSRALGKIIIEAPNPGTSKDLRLFFDSEDRSRQKDFSEISADSERINEIRPVYYKGQIIGDVWAEESKAYFSQTDLLRLFSGIGLMIIFLGIFILLKQMNILRAGLNEFVKGLENGTAGRSEKLLPELAPLMDEARCRRLELVEANKKLMTEIAIRREAEEEIKRSNNKIINIVESITDSFLVVDYEWNINYMNKEAETILGQNREDLMGKNIWERCKTSVAMREKFEAAARARESKYFEEYCRTMDSWFEFHLYPFNDGLSIYFRNVSNRKKAEKALRQSESRFIKVFNASPSMMAIIQLSTGRYIDVNESFLANTGYQRQDVIGFTPEELNFWFNPEKQKLFSRGLLEGESLLNQEIEFLTRDGEKRVGLAAGETLTLSDEECLLVAVTDITEHKQFEREMDHLERLNLIGQMAAGISHEMRNPMTTVRGFLQLLKSKEECRSYNEYHNLMIEELDRANSIITEFLSLGRNKAVELRVENLNKVIKKLAPLIEADALSREIELELDLREIPEFLFNEKELRQIVLNLAQNALDAMPEGGILKLSTFENENDIVFEVKDNGHGIDPEIINKIGTPFFTTKDQGTGLGLAVCHSIASRHNGTIQLSSSFEGTTFTVRFKKIRE